MKETGSGISFALRTIAGMIIHTALMVAALFNIEIAYEIVEKFYANGHESNFPPRALATVFAGSVFLAMVAGAFWVKSLFIQHFLPELTEK